MTWCGNLVVTTFNLTWCDKIKCVVIGLLYGCGAFQKLEISSKFLEKKAEKKIFVFLLP